MIDGWLRWQHMVHYLDFFYKLFCFLFLYYFEGSKKIKDVIGSGGRRLMWIWDEVSLLKSCLRELERIVIHDITLVKDNF